MQVKTFKPQLVALRDESRIDELKEALADVEHKPEIIPGEQGVIEVETFTCLIPYMIDWLMEPILFFLINNCFFSFSGCSSPWCSHCSYRNSWLCRIKGNFILCVFITNVCLCHIYNVNPKLDMVYINFINQVGLVKVYVCIIVCNIIIWYEIIVIIRAWKFKDVIHYNTLHRNNETCILEETEKR